MFFLWHFPYSDIFGTPGVIRHPALWSSDFPPSDKSESNCPVWTILYSLDINYILKNSAYNFANYYFNFGWFNVRISSFPIVLIYTMSKSFCSRNFFRWKYFNQYLSSNDDYSFKHPLYNTLQLVRKYNKIRFLKQQKKLNRQLITTD